MIWVKTLNNYSRTNNYITTVYLNLDTHAYKIALDSLVAIICETIRWHINNKETILRIDGNAHWTTAIMAMNSKSTAESAEFAELCEGIKLVHRS